MEASFTARQSHDRAMQDSFAEELLLKPIKRSRSDQSLTNGAPAASSHDCSLAVQYGGGGGARDAPPAPCTAFERTKPLPVVLSDNGSSSNSLISLESDSTRCSSGAMHSLLAAVHAAAHRPTGGTRESSPAHPRLASTLACSASAVSLCAQAPLVRGDSTDSFGSPDGLSTAGALRARSGSSVASPAGAFDNTLAAVQQQQLQQQEEVGAARSGHSSHSVSRDEAVGSVDSALSGGGAGGNDAWRRDETPPRMPAAFAAVSDGAGPQSAGGALAASAAAAPLQQQRPAAASQPPAANGGGWGVAVGGIPRTSRAGGVGGSIPSGFGSASTPRAALVQPATALGGGDAAAVGAAHAPTAAAVMWPSSHAARPSYSGSGDSGTPRGRRRSSLEVSMPWRQQVDKVIASVEHGDGVPRPPPPPPPSLPLGHSARDAGGAHCPLRPVLHPSLQPSEEEGEAEEQEDEEEGVDQLRGAGRWRNARAKPAAAALSALDGARDSGSGEGAVLASSRRQASGDSYLTSGSAGLELFLRMSRARQTLSFSQRQAHMFAELNRAELSVWEALALLGDVREYEARLWAPALPPGELDPDMSPREHACQVAELCRLAFPDQEWLHLVGLIHSLGKLLAHSRFGLQPQWAVAGETHPLGCRFAPQVDHAEYFSANPDRRRRAYSTPLGVYSAGCGLRNVYMSWAGPEYLYMVLVLNQVQLPEEALSIIRYQRFFSLTRPGGAYRELLSPSDLACLPLLSAFQRLAVYRRVELPPGALTGAAFNEYYGRLVSKYLGDEKLFF